MGDWITATLWPSSRKRVKGSWCQPASPQSLGTVVEGTQACMDIWESE